MIKETRVPQHVKYDDGKVSLDFDLAQQLSCYGTGTYQMRDAEIADDHVSVVQNYSKNLLLCVVAILGCPGS